MDSQDTKQGGSANAQEKEEEILSRVPPPVDVLIHYGEESEQFAELRIPPSQGPHPVVVVVHGGFWRAKYNLDHLGYLCAAITRHGYATYNLEYRRVGNVGGGFPGTFLDVGQGTDFLRKVAPKYGLDPSRVAAIGHSAGGHLALWLAGRNRIPKSSELATRDPLRLVGTISLAGIADLERAANLDLSSNAASELVGASPSELPERYRATSPVELLPLGTPQYLVHGENDSIVPPDMSREYYRKAIDMGDLVSLTIVPQTGHFGLIDPDNPAFTIILKTIERAFASPARS